MCWDVVVYQNRVVLRQSPEEQSSWIGSYKPPRTAWVGDNGQAVRRSQHHDKLFVVCTLLRRGRLPLWNEGSGMKTGIVLLVMLRQPLRYRKAQENNRASQKETILLLSSTTDEPPPIPDTLQGRLVGYCCPKKVGEVRV